MDEREVKQVKLCGAVSSLRAGHSISQRDVWPRVFVPYAWGRLLEGSVLSRSSQPLVRQHGVP